MRRTLLSGVVALAVAAAAAGGGWALETAALPPPAHADRIAARAAAWLLRYRILSDTFHAGGRTTEGLCLHAWFPRAGGGAGRGSLLLLEPRTRLLELGARIRRLEGRPQRGLPSRLALDVGCGAALGRRAALAAQDDPTLRIERAFAAGRPAIALRLPARAGERLTLWVAPRTYRPLVATATAGGRAATARIRFTRATPELLRRLTVRSRGSAEPST